VGGESRQGNFEPHPFDIGWANKMIGSCEDTPVHTFITPTGGRSREPGGRPLILSDPHGRDWQRWPQDLRVREVPKPLAVPVMSQKRWIPPSKRTEKAKADDAAKVDSKIFINEDAIRRRGPITPENPIQVAIVFEVSMAEEWEHYRDCVHEGTDPAELEDAKDAFYAGAYVIFSNLENATRYGGQAMVNEFHNRFMTEIIDYIKSRPNLNRPRPDPESGEKGS
jgi:hypothetical protein